MFGLFKNKRVSSSISVPNEIYGALVTQSRNPAFFLSYGFPDTVMGRFDVLSLHTYLFCRSMRQRDSENAQSLAQDVFDLMVADIERALRELGIGDTTVPKRKKQMVRSFYAQIDEFDPPLEKDDLGALEHKVAARFFETSPNADPKRLASYMKDFSGAVFETPDEEIFQGKIRLAEI